MTCKETDGLHLRLTTDAGEAELCIAQVVTERVPDCRMNHGGSTCFGCDNCVLCLALSAGTSASIASRAVPHVCRQFRHKLKTFMFCQQGRRQMKDVGWTHQPIMGACSEGQGAKAL